MLTLEKACSPRKIQDQVNDNLKFCKEEKVINGVVVKSDNSNMVNNDRKGVIIETSLAVRQGVVLGALMY